MGHMCFYLFYLFLLCATSSPPFVTSAAPLISAALAPALNGFNGYNGNCIGFNGNYNGVYWYVMDSVVGMLNPIGKMPKTHYKKEFCNGFTG